MIKLEEITEDNVEDVLKLKVSKNQENFVSTPAYSLAQAYVYRNNAYPFSIYADDTLVGFIMFGFYESRNQYTLWKFLIDEKYQNKGHGKMALLLGIEHMKKQHVIKEMYRKQSLDMKNTGCDSNNFVQITTGVHMSSGTKKDATLFLMLDLNAHQQLSL